MRVWVQNEKRNKPARVVAKNGGNFIDRVKTEQVTNSVCLSSIPGSSNILTSLMESLCIVFVGINFFFEHN